MSYKRYKVKTSTCTTIPIFDIHTDCVLLSQKPLQPGYLFYGQKIDKIWIRLDEHTKVPIYLNNKKVIKSSRESVDFGRIKLIEDGENFIFYDKFD